MLPFRGKVRDGGLVHIDSDSSWCCLGLAEGRHGEGAVRSIFGRSFSEEITSVQPKVADVRTHLKEAKMLFT